MKATKNKIPVYDLCTIDPGRVHRQVSAGPFSDFLSIRDKLPVPHRHSFYGVILFTKGHGIQKIDFEQFEIRPGRIFFMIPGQYHAWEFNDEMEGYTVNFTESEFCSFMPNNHYLEQFPFFRGVPAESFFDLSGDALKEAIFFFQEITEEVKKKDSFSLIKVCFHLISLFISVSRHNSMIVEKQVPDQKQSTLINFRKLVNLFYREKKLPRDYAAMLFITANHLNTVTNDLVGKSAGELIRERILLEAKRLLANTDLNISEIAYELNFTDNSYFTKFFKKYAGRTPEDFRNAQ